MYLFRGQSVGRNLAGDADRALNKSPRIFHDSTCAIRASFHDELPNRKNRVGEDGRCPLWVDSVDKVADEKVEALY
jgi:hypothetical protein